MSQSCKDTAALIHEAIYLVHQSLGERPDPVKVPDLFYFYLEELGLDVTHPYNIKVSHTPDAVINFTIHFLVNPNTFVHLVPGISPLHIRQMQSWLKFAPDAQGFLYDFLSKSPKNRLLPISRK